MNRVNSSRHINAHCRTDVGLVRRCNEDACLVNPEHNFFTVADGIGGAIAGDVASRIFLNTATEIFNATQPQNENEARELVTACFAEANQAIQQHTKFTPAHKGMGCTAELLVTYGDNYVLGHIGDSRTYMYLDGNLELLTTDHSLVQEQLQLGIINKEEAQKSRFKNFLSRAVGIDTHISADIHTGPLSPNALFLLCSDGLYNMVPAEKIIPVLQYNAPLSLKTEMLINMANDAGGKDNITVCLVENTA
jgi:PPM family protein phosphatase